MISTYFLKAAAAACLTSLLMAGCGGGSAADLAAAQQTPVPGRDGAAGAAVPILPAASASACASGADAPVRNSRLDCAP